MKKEPDISYKELWEKYMEVERRELEQWRGRVRRRFRAQPGERRLPRRVSET